jgi:thiol-disulfide isomerase/thioredoxin
VPAEPGAQVAGQGHQLAARIVFSGRAAVGRGTHVRTMPRPALAVALAITASTAVASLAACRREAAPPPGNIAARLTIPTRADTPFDPATLGGKPALVVFWRPGCPYCREELPGAQRAADERGVPAIAVQIAEGKTAGTTVLGQLAWKGVDLVDDGTLRRELAVKQVPWTLVLRSDGTAARAFVGRQSYETLKSALASVK